MATPSEETNAPLFLEMPPFFKNPSLYRLLEAPLGSINNPETRRRAVLMNFVGLCAGIFASLALLLTLVMLDGADLIKGVALNLVTLGLALSILWLGRRGKVVFSSMLIAASTPWVFFSGAFVAGYPEFSIFYTIVILVMSVMLEARLFWLTAAYAIGVAWILATAWPMQGEAAWRYPLNLTLLIIQLVVFASVATRFKRYVVEVLREREKSLAWSQANEQRARDARTAAERANKMKSEFLTNVSHELRTPLNTIIGFSVLIQEENADSGEAHHAEDIACIEQAAQHLLSLINDILDLSKLEAGQFTMELTRVDTSQLVRDVRATVAPLFVANANTFDVRADEPLPAMLTDATRTRQVLLNLLSNAAKFTRDGSVTLDVSVSDELILFEVSDTGIGMDEVTLERVFTEFQQASESTARSYGGTGLGLTIARNLCELMGGTLTATSTPGEGSVFTAKLPIESSLPGPMSE